MPTSPTSALIIGSSRGLGLGLAEEYLKRGWNVVGTVRASRRTALHEVAERSGGRLEVENVDVAQLETIAALSKRLAGRRFDVLFVVAGVGRAEDAVATVSDEEFGRYMITNALGPMRVIKALYPLVSERGVVGAMSSGLGSVANNETGGWEVYRASKAALNIMMRSFAARHAEEGRGFVVIAPGWVRTDMGGPRASTSVEENVPGIVDAIASQVGKTGIQFLDYRGRVVPW